MLRFETLPPSLAGLLWAFRWCFTGPSFATFAALVAGMIAQPGRRTVTGMLQAGGLAGVWHHSRAYWFLGRARWDLDRIGLVLAGLIVARLLPTDAPVLVAVDDTLFRRSGRRVAGAAWQHDASRRGPRATQVSAGVSAGAGPAVDTRLSGVQTGPGWPAGHRPGHRAARPGRGRRRRRALCRC